MLIIEDEWFIADHLQQLVESTGDHSISVEDTEEGAVWQAGTRRPEVIISDISLRSGTGLAAVSRIIEQHGPTPCLFVTAEPRQTLPSGPNFRVVRKPFANQDLVARFIELVPARQSS